MSLDLAQSPAFAVHAGHPGRTPCGFLQQWTYLSLKKIVLEEYYFPPFIFRVRRFSVSRGKQKWLGEGSESVEILMPSHKVREKMSYSSLLWRFGMGATYWLAPISQRDLC